MFGGRNYQRIALLSRPTRSYDINNSRPRAPTGGSIDENLSRGAITVQRDASVPDQQYVAEFSWRDARIARRDD
jgi:hypothetical protein